MCLFHQCQRVLPVLKSNELNFEIIALPLGLFVGILSVLSK